MVLQNKIFEKLSEFTDAENRHIRQLLDQGDFNKLTDEDEYIFLKMWKAVDATTSQYQKDLLIDILERITIKDELPNFHLAYEGENIEIEIELDPDEDDFTGSFLLARNDEDKAALSALDQAGTAEQIQTVRIVDISLAGGDFYKIIVVTEGDDGGGQAGGDVFALINEIFLYLEPDIDSDV